MIVVVGGQARKTGKSAVVEGLIAALRDFNWTAIKITRHKHGEGWGVTEERVPGLHTDTARFLAAGARRSFWIRTPDEAWPEVVREVQRLAGSGGHTIIESSSIAAHLRPDISLVVLDRERRDFKESAERMLHSADAVLVRGEPMERVRCFQLEPPQYVTPAIVEFVRSRLACGAS